jgi:4'-phosphopantetheinyl transferase EntD
MPSVAASPNVVLLAAIFTTIGIVIGLALASLLFHLREASAPSEDQKLQRLHERLRQQIATQAQRKAERRASHRSPALFAIDGVPAAERIGKSAKPSWPPQDHLDALPADGGLMPLPQLPGVKR